MTAPARPQFDAKIKIFASVGEYADDHDGAKSRFLAI